jgi:EAL domain-containing protein (putative c-di-GMP-specific phosphodiesterase class I)
MEGQAARKITGEEVASQLPAALKQGGMHLYYQPVVSLADRSATVLEALPRWDHAEYGVLGPASFIDAAREAGLLESLERWAIYEAIHQLAYWSRGVPAQLSISVNLSTSHALSPGLSDTVRELTKQTEVTASRFGIELSAGALLDVNADEMLSLRELADVGVHLTLDGFDGSLSPEQIGNLPISSIKIGREVIAMIPDSDEHSQIVAKAISIGREMGIGVIATGIESPGQAAALRAAGCHYGQGFLFSVPMPAEVLEERVAAR